MSAPLTNVCLDMGIPRISAAMTPNGTFRTYLDVRVESVMRSKADTHGLSIEIIHKIHDVSIT